MTKIHIKRLFLCTLFLVTLAGCSEKQVVQETLCRVETIVDFHPDSAYTLLQNIESKKLRTRSGRARYALLYTWVQDKRYVDETNDSLISMAVDYYRYHGDVRHRFLSLYYKGRVLYNAGDYLKAMSAYAEAELLVTDLQDDYHAGLLYTQLGNIYKVCCDYPKSLETYRKAYLFYERADKESHRAYALLDQANICWQMNKFVECERLYHLALAESIRMADENLHRLCMGELFMVYMEQSRLQEAKEVYRLLISRHNLSESSAKFWSVVAELYAIGGLHQEAESYLRQAWEMAGCLHDSISVYFAESHLYIRMNKPQQAYSSLNKGNLLQTKEIYERLQHPVHSAQRDFLAQELAFLNYRRNVEKGLWIGLVVLLVACMLLAALRLRKKMRQKDESIQSYIESIAEMERTMKRDNSEKSMQILELFREQFKIVSMFGDSFQHIVNKELHQKEVYTLVQDLIHKFDKDSKSYLQFEEIVNRYNDNVMQQLRNDVKLREDAYRQMCYHMAGFSVNVVSLFMKEALPTLYKRRSRTLEKIKGTDSPYKEKFINLIGN